MFLCYKTSSIWLWMAKALLKVARTKPNWFLLWVQQVFPAVQPCTASPSLSPCSLGFGDVQFSLAGASGVVIELCSDVGRGTERMWWLVWAFNSALSFPGALLWTPASLSPRKRDDGLGAALQALSCLTLTKLLVPSQREHPAGLVMENVIPGVSPA